MNKGNFISILERVSTALSLTWLFLRTIGVLMLGIYFFVFALTEPFKKSYQEDMYLSMGVVTSMIGILLIGMQMYLVHDTKLKLKQHEEQLNKKTD